MVLSATVIAMPVILVQPEIIIILQVELYAVVSVKPITRKGPDCDTSAFYTHSPDTTELRSINAMSVLS